MTTALIIIAVMLVLGFIGNAIKEADLKPVGDIPGDGDFEHEVVGESHYQDALIEISEGLGDDRICQAALVLEDDNPHDNKAVGVYIDKKKVGHMSREDARKFRTHLKKNKYPEGTYSCKARLFGGTKGKETIGVWLDVYNN